MQMRIEYKLKAPLSHIGESASTGSYFQTVLTSAGKLPVVTANSIRGQVRDAIAMHWLDLTGAKLDKDVFNIFFSGGNLNGTMKNDIAKAKAVREHFPGISLLGGGLGDMILAGKLICTMAYPVCKESEEITGLQSNISWHSLIDEIEFTRTDDGKNELLDKYLIDPEADKTAKASTQMRFSVQYLSPGTELVQDIIFLPGTTDLEVGAFLAGLAKWWQIPRMGGMAARGFGYFTARIDDGLLAVDDDGVQISNEVKKCIDAYEELIRTEGAEYLDILAASKKGKK